MTKHPEKMPPQDGRTPSIKTRCDLALAMNRHNTIDLCMVSDRPCISDRGMMVNVGTKVTYLGHLPGHAVKVRMEDGSEEVVHPHCFPELR